MPRYWDWLARSENLSWLWSAIVSAPTIITGLLAYTESVPWTLKVPALTFAVCCSSWLWMNWPHVRQRWQFKSKDEPNTRLGGMFAEAYDPEFQRKQAEGHKVQLPREYYSRREKDRIADALTELSDVINNEGGKVLDRARQVQAIADYGNESDITEALQRFEQASVLFNRSIDANSEGLLQDHQAFRIELESVIQKDTLEILSRELTVAVRHLVYSYRIIYKVHLTVPSIEMQQFREAILVHFRNLAQASADLHCWQKACEIRSNELRVLLAKKGELAE